jgi:flagellar motor switch protein FliN/FliY
MTAPLHWVKEIQLALIEAQEIPLHGQAPEFPWEEVQQKIASSLQLPDLRIIPGQTQLLSGGKITEGLGAEFIAIPLEMAPLTGKLFWLMAKEDIAKLTMICLTSSNGNKGFTSPKFQEGFYYFLATKATAAINELNAFGDLSPKIGKMAEIPQEEALCIDVRIEHPKQVCWGRVVCPASLHREFKMHFSDREPAPLSSSLAKQIDVPIKIEVGQTALSLSKWKSISVGDFLLLDRCTFDPQTHKGTATLTLHRKPLFRARVKENHLKIVDYAFYREEQNTMNAPEDNPEEPSLEEGTEENHLWSTENPAEAMSENIIPTGEIPMTLTVEVARLTMNLDKLLQLSPGNVVELPVKPEQGIDLTIDGKKVAKGELVKLGEMLGVRILQLGGQ